MMKFKIDYTNAKVSQEKLNEAFQKLKPEIEQIKSVSPLLMTKKTGYESSFFLPFDHDSIQTIKSIIREKKMLNPTMLIVIGIGGSNLGTVAVQEAIFGKLYNETNPPIKIYYADTVDSDYCALLLSQAQRELEHGNTILINLITKSGTTTETIANFELFLTLLQKYHPETYQHSIVVTTDRGSKLSQLATTSKFTVLEIPPHVGGRYSVFSAVGLFPLGIIGCDIDKLIDGAKSIFDTCTSAQPEHNYAASTAIIKYEQYNNGITIQDMFIFCVQLEGVGRWYRQLMGESIGKEFNLHGAKVEVGITPTVSMGTVDLHSVGQLYLGGPRDKGTTFISVERFAHTLVIPQNILFNTLAPHIQGKSVASIMLAILQGVKTAYRARKRPFVSLEIPEHSAYYIGQLLQYLMFEMVYLGYLLEVNPFDQPNVELYKEETRKILGKNPSL